MDYGKLGRTDLSVSRIGMGCVTFGREIDEAASFAVADRAFERGVTLFDTADCYAVGASETVLGRWIADRGVRNRIMLATKVGGPMSTDPKDRGCSRRHIMQSLEGSLSRLGVDHIDLYYVHCWDADVPPLETLEALSYAVTQGKVRAIGCSNYAAWQLCRMLWLAEAHGLERFAVVQPAYSLVKREVEQEMIPLCRDQEIGIVSYSPLAAGFLTGKYRKGQTVPAGTRFAVRPLHQNKYFHDSCFRILEALSAKARAMSVSIIHLALAWALTQPAVASTLIGARNPAQVDQAFDAMELDMSDALREELSAMADDPLLMDTGGSS